MGSAPSSLPACLGAPLSSGSEASEASSSLALSSSSLLPLGSARLTGLRSRADRRGGVLALLAACYFDKKSAINARTASWQRWNCKLASTNMLASSQQARAARVTGKRVMQIGIGLPCLAAPVARGIAPAQA
jgi:hypothetical protein